MDLTASIKATVHGDWGFQPFDGPSVQLQPAKAGKWRVALGQSRPKETGQVELAGGAAACVTRISLGSGPVAWKRLAPDRISIAVPRGDTTIEVQGPKGAGTEQIVLASPPPPVRFSAAVIARHIERPPQVSPVPITLGSEDQVPSDATLRVSFRVAGGAKFGGGDTIEVAAGSGGGVASLTTTSGFTIADPQVAVATIQPASALGASAYGPLRARVVHDGIAGDWLPIGTLVRLPEIRQLRCPEDPKSAACELSGDNLFLISAVSANEAFDNSAAIPDGYPGNTIQVPRPVGKTLFVRWHDDPAHIGRIGS